MCPILPQPHRLQQRDQQVYQANATDCSEAPPLPHPREATLGRDALPPLLSLSRTAWSRTRHSAGGLLQLPRQMPAAALTEVGAICTKVGVREPRHVPTGAPKAAETPAAAPADTKSLFSVSLRKYSKIWDSQGKARLGLATHQFRGDTEYAR